MICPECCTAGAYNSMGKFALAEANHKECKGDCTCLHKTGPGWFVGAKEKAPLMQVQSP